MNVNPNKRDNDEKSGLLQSLYQTFLFAYRDAYLLIIINYQCTSVPDNR